MKLLIETSAGTFAAYVNSAGDISIYEGDDDSSLAVIGPPLKRRATVDLSADAVANAVRVWLETNYERLEIESVIVRLVPPGR